MTDQERNQVLKMIEDGKITPEEGLTLMQALDQRIPPRKRHQLLPRRPLKRRSEAHRPEQPDPSKPTRTSTGSNPPSAASGRSRSGSASSSPS